MLIKFTVSSRSYLLQRAKRACSPNTPFSRITTKKWRCLWESTFDSHKLPYRIHLILKFTYLQRRSHPINNDYQLSGNQLHVLASTSKSSANPIVSSIDRGLSNKGPTKEDYSGSFTVEGKPKKEIPIIGFRDSENLDGIPNVTLLLMVNAIMDNHSIKNHYRRQKLVRRHTRQHLHGIRAMLKVTNTVWR